MTPALPLNYSHLTVQRFENLWIYAFGVNFALIYRLYLLANLGNS